MSFISSHSLSFRLNPRACHLFHRSTSSLICRICLIIPHLPLANLSYFILLFSHLSSPSYRPCSPMLAPLFHPLSLPPLLVSLQAFHNLISLSCCCFHSHSSIPPSPPFSPVIFHPSLKSFPRVYYPAPSPPLQSSCRTSLALSSHHCHLYHNHRKYTCLSSIYRPSSRSSLSLSLSLSLPISRCVNFSLTCSIYPLNAAFQL